MKSLTFELASIADAIKKAAIVAPTTGMAFDKSAGILLSADTDGHAIVKSTDTQIYFTQRLESKTKPSENVSWLLDSRTLQAFLGSLPTSFGKAVVFTEIKGDRPKVEVSCLRAKLKFFLMIQDNYPHWSDFDPSLLVDDIELGSKLNSVQWACAKNAKGSESSILAGVHMDGKNIVATNRFVLASEELEIPGLSEPITIAAGMLADIVKNGEVAIGSNGNQLLLMSDEYTQIRATLYADSYPNYARIMNRGQPRRVTVSKNEFLALISRAQSVSEAERNHVFSLFIGKNEIALMSDLKERGLFGDVITLSGADHVRREYKFPSILLGQILQNCTGESIQIGYDSDSNSAFYFSSGTGYEVWTGPIPME